VGPSPIFSLDGRELAASDLGDETVCVFDVATRRAIGAPLALHRAFPFPAVLSGDRLVTAGADEAAVWRLDARLPPPETVLPAGSGVVVAQFADGLAGGVATLGSDGVHIWNPETGRVQAGVRYPGFDPWYPPSFSPDGKFVAAGDHDGTFSVWDR